MKEINSNRQKTVGSSSIHDFKENNKQKQTKVNIANRQSKYSQKIEQAANVYGITKQPSKVRDQRALSRQFSVKKNEAVLQKKTSYQRVQKTLITTEDFQTINNLDEIEFKRINYDNLMQTDSIQMTSSTDKINFLESRQLKIQTSNTFFHQQQNSRQAQIRQKQSKTKYKQSIIKQKQLIIKQKHNQVEKTQTFMKIQPINLYHQHNKQVQNKKLMQHKKQAQQKKQVHNGFKNQIFPKIPLAIQTQHDREKLKFIYDKVRNNKATEQTEDKINVSAERNVSSRNRIQDQIEYLSKITGKSPRKQKITNLTPAEQLLSGKMTIVWIFSIKDHLQKNIRDRIFSMYNALIDEDKIVPFVTDPKQIRNYLNIPNCFFKIVTDIQCAETALGYKIYNSVIQFYIFNDQKKDTLQKALQFKSLSKKIKGIFTDWDKILCRAQQEIQQEISIYKVNNGMQKRQRQRKFPNFLKLSNTDKTQATLYRINLYGSIKLLNEQKIKSFEDFLRLVVNKYGSNLGQKQNIEDYNKLEHQRPISTEIQAREVVKFYVRQSFYYQVVNSMLRTMKTSEEFRPCILPFNETYHSVKYFYKSYLEENKYQIPQMTLYRGCKIRKRNFQELKPGVFIQMFGFMSTSKDQSRAQSFVDNDGYLFVIHVKKRKIHKKFANFDHGFVDINKYNLASQQFKQQQQILFNSLNVYQVIKIEQKDDYTYIHLEYGVIFQLLDKPRNQLTSDQYDTIVNYHYCTKILGKIQDQGDVFLFANQFSEAKQYYDNKIKNGDNLAHNYFKLANVQKQCGEIDQAEKNAQNALKIYGQQIDINDREKCLKIFGIHTKNAQINLGKEDYLTADTDIDKAIAMLSDDQLFQKGIKYRERGQIKFKKGQVKQAQSDFQISQQIFQNLKNQTKIRKLSAYKNYYCSHFSLLCSQKTRQNIKFELQNELCKIQQLQQKILQINQDIEDELVKINKSLKDVSLYVQNRENYQIYVKKAQGYLISLQARKANDPDIKAKLLTMQAMISDYQQLAQSQKLMNQAIKLIEERDPYNEKVGDYSKILARMQKMELQKYTNPSKNLINTKPSQKIPYNSTQRKGIYNRCKQNFKKTLTVLAYHSKDKASPQILDIKNQLGELSFNQADYEECQRVVKEIRSTKNQTVHSEMAKSLLLMAKISYARGELKNSFRILQQAQTILEAAMVTKHLGHDKKITNSELAAQKEKYVRIFQNSDTLLIIKFVRTTIYHKQKDHDLALKSILNIESTIVSKVGSSDSHPLLADLLQVRGGIQVFRGNVDGFDTFFQKAITLRQKQFGYYHPMNAKAYCSYAKYLIMVKDMKEAQAMLRKAVQIISAFDQTNPNYWVVYYSQGFLKQDLLEYDQADIWYQKSLKWAKQHFNKSHITITQIMLRYANTLSKSHKLNESILVYQQLQKNLENGIRQSNTRFQVQQQKDDQKISLKKLMYSQLSQMNIDEEQINQNLTNVSTNKLVDTSLYKSKLSLLRNTYNISKIQ